MISASIIVVEDERIVALQIRRQLEKLGYEVPAVVSSGAKALAAIDEHRPNVVLMDIHIEGDIDGIETASRIPAEWGTAVIFLTAYSEDNTLERARAAKPYGYLIKPYSERELHATIQMALERQVLVRELHSARIEAEAATVAKSQFLANISHEIRTPLTSIIGFSDLLGSMRGLPAKAKTYAGRVRTNGESLLHVINDILDLSSIESGSISLASKPYDPAALVTSVIDSLSLECERKQILIAAMVSQSVPPFVQGDGARVRQVLTNLISNAVKFTDAGMVTVQLDWTSAPSSKLTCRVADSGLGIPAEQRSRLFQRFSQVDGSSRRKYGGTGLGLAISKEIVTAMAGEIGHEPNHPHGSVFWFTIEAESAEACDGQTPTQPSPNILDGVRILIVDDTAHNREIIKIVLGELGAELVEAADGQDAIDACSASRFDLILMDVQMPGMDGIAATKIIRSGQGRNRQTPILAFSASDMEHDLRVFHEAGMNDHIAKPTKPRDLVNKIVQWAQPQA